VGKGSAGTVDDDEIVDVGVGVSLGAGVADDAGKVLLKEEDGVGVGVVVVGESIDEAATLLLVDATIDDEEIELSEEELDEVADELTPEDVLDWMIDVVGDGWLDIVNALLDVVNDLLEVVVMRLLDETSALHCPNPFWHVFALQ
jgi:hypothetical protein